MNKFKKVIAVILCLVMAIGNLSLAFGAETELVSDKAKDYEGHWAQKTIQKWIDESKISGYPDGSFKPDENITRAEFVKIVNSIIDYDVKGTIAFDDVKSSDWYYNIISIAQEIGYISGYSKNQFGPNDNITREQAAAIIARIQYLGVSKDAAKKFADSNNISAWALGLVGSASEAGFVNGFDGSFNPANKLTRAEAITMIDNVLVKAKNKVIYKKGTELKDAVIDGNLIIAKTVGEGDVRLTNVEVKGNIFVYGGGANSLYFNNVKVARIEVEKNKVRLVFDNGTKVQEVKIGAETKLENKNGQVAKVTIDSEGKVTLSGSFDNVNIVSKVDVVLDDAKIENLVIEQPANIFGTGTIATLTANADGIKYDSTTKITKTVVGENVTVKPEENIATPGGGGGGGGPVTPDPTYILTATYSFAYNKEVLIDGSYSSSTVYNGSASVSKVLGDEIKFIIAELKKESSPVKTKVTNYLAKLNAKLAKIEIIERNGVVLYQNNGKDITVNWDKLSGYLDGTSIVLTEQLKGNLSDGVITVQDVIDVLSLYNSNTIEADLAKINQKLPTVEQSITITAMPNTLVFDDGLYISKIKNMIEMYFSNDKLSDINGASNTGSNEYFEHSFKTQLTVPK